MFFVIFSIFLYLGDIILSLIISISIIEKLYISKKFNKKDHFHFYNELFSWEIFFILLSISNSLQIISSVLLTDTIIAKFLLEISILIMYNNFWLKIIHTEKLMNLITYERHYFAGIIPIVIVLVIFILNLEVSVLLLVFLATSLLPFLFVTLFLRNTGITLKKTAEICVGSFFFGSSLFLNPIFLKNLSRFIQIPISIINLMYIIVPLFLIIGTLIIFDTFRKDIF